MRSNDHRVRGLTNDGNHQTEIPHRRLDLCRAAGRRPTRRSTPRSSAPGRRRTNGRRPRSPSAANTCSPCSKRWSRMTDEIVPELAWQMGRPVRYGGEFGGVKERTQLHGRDRRAGARAGAGLQPEGRLPPLCEEGSARRRHGHRAVELSLSHRRQHHRAGADGRQRRSSSSMPRRRCWSASASQQAFEKAGLPKGVFQNLV